MGLFYSDIPELVGTDTEVTLANLRELEERLDEVLEERIAHLCELSHAIIRDGEEADVIKSIILSLKSEGYADPEKIISENFRAVEAVYSRLSLVERLILCENISSYFRDENRTAKKSPPNEEGIALSSSANERIAYLKNSYNDTAYIQFSTLMVSPRAAYFESITDVCESVFNGQCEYCILPVETSSDGKLSGFYDRILKYGFRILAVYDLESSDKKRNTRYALLSRGSASKNPRLRHRSKVRYFEFALECEEYPTLTDILAAADYCSLKLIRIDTLNCRDREKGKKVPLICPVFRADGADLNTFLTFLSIDCPDFLPIGIYTQV